MFQVNRNTTKFDQIDFCRCSVCLIFMEYVYVFININIVRHLKLEIALAIPAANK